MKEDRHQSALKKPRRPAPTVESGPEPRKVKKKIPAVYVEPRYPVWLGLASFAWALVGWFVASLAPNLAFVPMVGVIHYLFPAVTVGLIAANAYFALGNLWNGV